MPCHNQGQLQLSAHLHQARHNQNQIQSLDPYQSPRSLGYILILQLQPSHLLEENNTLMAGLAVVFHGCHKYLMEERTTSNAITHQQGAHPSRIHRKLT